MPIARDSFPPAIPSPARHYFQENELDPTRSGARISGEGLLHEIQQST